MCIRDSYGAYVARFFINWEEITYDGNGKELRVKKSWIENGWNKTDPFRTVINLPANSTNIDIQVQGATGLVWEPWRTSVNKKGLPLINSRTVSVSGTTLNQTGIVTPNN